MAEDKFADEMLTDDELDGVTGGTGSELGEIAKTIYEKTGKIMGLYDLPDYLKEKYGIDADIDGIPELYEGRKNVYRLNGEEITHDQVKKMLSSS